jgi:hypothetical protein
MMGKSDLVCGLPMLELRAILAEAAPGGHLGDVSKVAAPASRPLCVPRMDEGRV